MKSKLSETTTENPKYEPKDQLDTREYIKNIYNLREEVIKLYKCYSKIISEALYKTKHGTDHNTNS